MIMIVMLIGMLITMMLKGVENNHNEATKYEISK